MSWTLKLWSESSISASSSKMSVEMPLITTLLVRSSRKVKVINGTSFSFSVLCT